MKYKPSVVIFSGLSFTGKSTLAHTLSFESNYHFIEGDSYRYRLLGHKKSLPDTLEERMMIKAYKLMHDDVLTLIQRQTPVVIAATYYRKAYKPLLEDFITHIHVPLVIFGLYADDKTIKERIKDRSSTDYSDIRTFEQYKQMEADADPITLPVIYIKTNKPMVHTLSLIRKYLKGYQV